MLKLITTWRGWTGWDCSIVDCSIGWGTV